MVTVRTTLRLTLQAVAIGTVLVLAAVAVGTRIPAQQLTLFSRLDPNESHVYLVDVGRRLRVNMSLHATAVIPRWSPDGTRLLWQPPLNNGSALGTSRWNGVGFVQPVDFEGVFIPQGTWSPDSSQIVTVAHRDRFQTMLTLWNPETNAMHFIEGQYLAEPDWSPDGRYVLVNEWQDRNPNQQVLVIDLESDVVHPVSLLVGGERSPVWSPDGQMLAFYSPVDVLRKALFVVETTGSRQPPPLISGVLADIPPIWRGSDELLVFDRDHQLVRVHAQHGMITPLTALAGVPNTAVLTPDAQTLVVSFSGSDGEQIVSVDLFSGEQRLLWRSKQERYPVLRWSPDGRYVAYTTDPPELVGVLDMRRGRSVYHHLMQNAQMLDVSWRPS